MDLNKAKVHLTGHKECPDGEVLPWTIAPSLKARNLNGQTDYQKFSETNVYRKDLAALKLRLYTWNGTVQTLSRTQVR